MQELHQVRSYIQQANPQIVEDLRQLLSSLPKPEAALKIAREDQDWLEILETRVQKKLSAPDYCISQLAYDLAMSESSLLRRMHRLYGLSPKQYITEQRLLAAKKMLEDRQSTCVGQVARAVGFRDAKAFSRCFKLRFGEPPSALLQD